MDIKGDAGFLREYPNIHVSRTYVNNLTELSNCIPFSFTNLSMHSQYLGKDKVVGFAEPTTDEVEVHDLVDYDEIKEMTRGSRCKLLFPQVMQVAACICPKGVLFFWGIFVRGFVR